jgi:NADH:ubiquinone oxidoreductase subunit E
VKQFTRKVTRTRYPDILDLSEYVRKITRSEGAVKTITVCIGSGCHLKGAHRIIDRLKTLLSESGLSAEIRLKASFCQGQCTRGVVVSFDDRVYTGVSPDTIDELFAQETGGVQ